MVLALENKQLHQATAEILLECLKSSRWADGFTGNKQINARQKKPRTTSKKTHSRNFLTLTLQSLHLSSKIDIPKKLPSSLHPPHPTPSPPFPEKIPKKLRLESKTTFATKVAQRFKQSSQCGWQKITLRVLDPSWNSAIRRETRKVDRQQTKLFRIVWDSSINKKPKK